MSKQKPPIHQDGGYYCPLEIFVRQDFSHRTSTALMRSRHLTSPFAGCQTSSRKSFLMSAIKISNRPKGRNQKWHFWRR